jgi:pimeloyl-ACP methyl ester carboxylesterase
MQDALKNVRVVLDSINERITGAPISVRLCKQLLGVTAGAPVVAFATSFVVTPRSIIHRVFFGAFFSAGVWAIAMLFRVLVVPFIIMPAQLVSTMNKEPLREHKSRFLATYRNVASSLSIPTEDGTVLDAVLIRNQSSSGLEPAKRPWVLWFNTNGVCLEENLGFAEVYARTIGANILVFNFRGVGESTGQILQFSDMLIDGRAAFKFLLDNEGATPDKILLHGHSMGAAVACMLRREYPDGPIVHDRSFGSLTAVVKTKLTGDMKLIGLAVSVFAAVALSVWNAVIVICLRFPQGQAGVLLIELIALLAGLLHVKQLEKVITTPALRTNKDRITYAVGGLVGFAALAYLGFGAVPFAIPFVTKVRYWISPV